MMKEKSDMKWWPHDHKEMALGRGNEDQGDRALGGGQGVK
jgi:hypothetical protein